MSQNCCTPDENIMILACSGGSNVGQLTNQAAVELTREGFGKMFCLAGIGGQLSGFVQSAIVFIDVWKHKEQAKRFGIRAIPTQIFFDENGKEVFRHVGFMSEKAIVNQLKKMGVE